MEEEIKCKGMADLAMADLDAAMPALEAAMKVILVSQTRRSVRYHSSSVN